MKKITLFLVAITMSLFSFAQTQMSGTYTVGTGGSYDYSSMADAGMAIKDAEFTGDVTLLICTDLTETINTGIVNKSNYTLTIRPDKDENRTITYTTATDNTGPTGVFVIGGDMTKTPGNTIGWASVPTKNVIVDGAAEGKTTPRLKITTGKWGTNFLLYGDVQDCVVKNCILVNTYGEVSAHYAITFRSENYSKTSKNIGPKNCVVENCILEATHATKSQTVYFQGNQANSAAGYPANITIRNCNIKAHTRGMFLYGVNGLNVEGCTFDMSETPGGYMCHGILGTTVRGTINVRGNKFIKNSTKNTSAGEYGLQTITASGGATLWVIENNYFAGYNALASGTTTKESRLVGIRCGDPCEIRHNTFYMPKLTYAPATPLVSTQAVALLWLAGSHQYPVQNNIFVCEETTANVSLIRGGLNENVTGNIFYHKGGNAAIVAAASSCMTFANLETSYSTQAATSKWTNVTFADAANGDLSLAGNSNGDETLAVSRLAEVLTDITGKSRREQTYAGAYEGANFPSNMPSSITLNAHPVKDYSASIVGTMKRAIQNGENTIVLTHEADGTPHIYNIAHATKTITEISQEGVIAVDPDNAGDYLAISDIALTEDGKLIASNYMRCEQGTTPATGYKVGEIRYYIWNDITAAPTRWFTTNKTANSTYADVSYTFAIKGTSTNAQLMSTAVHNNNRAARINLHTVVNGAETAYHRFGLHTSASEYTEAKQGTNFQITATPLDNIWALEGELTDPTSFAVPATIGDPYTGTTLKNTDLGKKYTGASYLNYDGHYLMVAPYANGEGKLAGVKVLGITLGFDDAISVATSTDLSNAIDATAAAATAYVDGDGDLTIYLIADGKVYAFSEKAYEATTYTVTAIAGEGGTVEGGGLYEEGSTAIVTASPAEHYDFVNWTEGEEVVSTTAEYSFTVTTDIELTANFQEHAKYTITASAADNTMGYVTGSGTYYAGETVTLKAVAKTGYYFTGWSDSNTDNPRTFTATENVTLQANFATAHPRVYAYDLNVVDNGDSYTFTFKPNTDAVSGNLLLYSEDGASVVQTHAIGTPIAAHTATTITLNKTDLPDQSEVPWAIELSGNAIPAFAETFADSDLRFARAHAVVDNSPESEYFGRVYVADRRSTKSNSKVYVYNPDFTDLTATNLGLATAGYSRPAVGADGTLYLTGYTDGAEAGIFVVNPADLTKCTQFFNGTYDSDGLYKNNGKEIGSSTSGVGVYGAGKDAVLYTMMEDGSNANFISGIQPIVKYQIGQENGTVLKQWSDEPTWLVNYPATGKDSYNFGNNDFAATAKGVWVSQNKSNIDDRPEIAFVDKTGTIQFMQNSNKCLGGGMTVNADNTVLYIVEDSKILEYAIAWNENTPSLTLSKSYPISLANVSTLSMDYAGNLIACAGTSYSTTDDNKMKVVCFTLPTDNNHSIVPAAKTKAIKLGARYTVTVVVNDESMGAVIGAGSYKEGEIVELAAAPVANHRIVDWKKGEDVLSTSLTCSFEVTEDVTINVTFEKIPQYTVTTIASPAGKGSITGGGLYNEGTNVTLTATAHTGYIFVRWEDDDTAEATRTITVTGDITYTAIFDKVSPRAWAYDLRLDSVADPANYTFTFKTTSAGSATLIFKNEDGNIQNFGTHTATATEAGEQTITIAKTVFVAATKDIYWEVKMEGAAIENMVEVTDPAAGIYNFYVPQGIAVDNNTNSNYFGQIYVAQATNGASDGGSEMAKNQTVGLFVYDQKLTLKNTNYEGIAPQNVAFNTGNPIGSIDAIRQQMHRIAVDPITSEIAFAYYKSDATPATAIYAMNPTELLGNATNLINGASITKANSLCYDEKGALYVMDNANTGTVGGQIYKVQNGEVTLFAAHDKNNQWAVYDNAMASDGRGGIWIAQNRYGYDYPILSHVNKYGVVDFAVKENLNSWFPNTNTGSSYRGQCAYNLNENILAFAGNKMVTLFTVEYDGDGKPTINKLMSTPLLGGGYIDGVAFDYAGDLYVASASAERLYKFVVPTNTNTCTVPAPESQVIEKEQKYTVTVVASPAEGGSVSGGGEAAAGAQVTVSATANTGYRFVNWTKGSDEVSTDASFSYTVPTEGVTLIANFEKISYTLTVFVNDETKGTIDVTTGSYEYGSEVTLTATPNPGYKLLAWSNKAKTPSITITMDNNKAVSAYFVKDYDVEPTISVTQVWKNTDVPATTMNGFQAVGWGGKIYLKDRLSRTIWEYSSESVKEVYTLTDDFTSYTDETLKGDQPIAVDNAGNLIVRSGSGEFHTAPVQVTIYRNGEKTGKTVDFTLPATGRCDFITASGDIFSEKGGYIYFLCKDQKTVSRLFIKNGAITAEDVAVDAVATIPTAASSQSNVVLDIYGNIHTQSKNAGAYEYNITTLAATADPYLGAATKKNPNSTIGGCTFELGGKELWAYAAGTTNYSSEWELSDANGGLVSDGVLCINDLTTVKNNTAANWLNVQVVDENTAYIYQFCPTVGVAVWKVSIETEVNVTIDENADNTATLTPYEGEEVNATVNRNFGANKILTVTLPFDMDATQISTFFGMATIYEFYNVVDAGEELHLQFSRTTSIEAGKPYIIQTAASGYDAEDGFTIEGVTVTTELTPIELSGITMVPVLNGGGRLENANEYFLSNSALYCAGDYPRDLQGLRAYFTSNSSKTLRARVVFDDNEETSLPTITNPNNNVQKIVKNGQLIIIRGENQYNAQGQTISIE